MGSLYLAFSMSSIVPPLSALRGSGSGRVLLPDRPTESARGRRVAAQTAMRMALDQQIAEKKGAEKFPGLSENSTRLPSRESIGLTSPRTSRIPSLKDYLAKQREVLESSSPRGSTLHPAEAKLVELEQSLRDKDRIIAQLLDNVEAAKKLGKGMPSSRLGTPRVGPSRGDPEVERLSASNIDEAQSPVKHDIESPPVPALLKKAPDHDRLVTSPPAMRRDGYRSLRDHIKLVKRGRRITEELDVVEKATPKHVEPPIETFLAEDCESLPSQTELVCIEDWSQTWTPQQFFQAEIDQQEFFGAEEFLEPPVYLESLDSSNLNARLNNLNVDRVLAALEDAKEMNPVIRDRYVALFRALPI